MTPTRRRQAVLVLALFALLFLNFSMNAFGVALDKTWQQWQLVGQGRVLGGIVADARGLEKGHVQLGEVYPGDEAPAQLTPQFLTAQTYRIYADLKAFPDIVFRPYRAQSGLQGRFYSGLHSMGISSITALQTMVAILTSIAVVILFLFYVRAFNLSFALLFVACLALSPYFTTMARNLYWSPYLLFLPAIAACWIYLDRRPGVRTAGLVMVTIAMYLKCASNYEYITSVTLLACAVFIAGPYFSNPSQPRPEFGLALQVGMACVVGFSIALLLHAQMRGGGDLIVGLQDIYTQDIARRTFGDASRFTGETAESMRASVLDVLRIYFYEKYPGRSEMMMPGKVFLLLFVLALAGLVHKALTRHRNFQRDALLFLVFLSVPLSWFVLAKGHAFTQTHINFVLWFIGCMPAMIYVAASAVLAPLARDTT
jgi:hypothetical protein